MKAVLDQK